MLEMETTRIDYRALEPFGEYRLLVKLADGTLPAHLLLFDPGKPSDPSGAADLNRACIAETIAEANPNLPAPSVNADYIIAGQQAGLMLGPLYTFLKAISVISLARTAQLHHSHPVLPLFWIASEDHDILEVNRLSIHGKRFVHETSIPIKRGEMPPVGDVVLTAVRDPLLMFLEENLPPSEFRPWLLDLVATTDFANYNRAFHHLLQRLFGRWQLRSIDPQALRSLTAPALSRIVSRWPEVRPALETGSAHLEAVGLPAPLRDAAVFELVGGKRRRVLSSDDDGDGHGLAAAIRTRPDAYSPSAALRPICQDAALPILATIGGPSELAYLWQTLPLYDLAEARPSRRFPRISASFIDGGILRVAEKAKLMPSDLFDAPARLREVGAQMRAVDPQFHSAGGSSNTEIHQDSDIRNIVSHGAALLGEIDRLGGTDSPRWLKKGRASIATGLERIVERVQQERQGTLAVEHRRLERVTQALLPGNKLQERMVNLLQMLNLHGPEFIDCAIDRLDPVLFQHQMVALRSVMRDSLEHGKAGDNQREE